MAKRKPKKKIVPVKCIKKRFGIMNHLGDLWTIKTWDKAEDAEAYKAEYMKKSVHCDLRAHRVVPVRVTVTVIRAKT